MPKPTRQQYTNQPSVKKTCHFCGTHTRPTYTDIVALRRFVSSRAKIVAKQRSGVCAKHQRRLTTEIKRARHLALLSFTAGV